jgi:hypothetical protein
MIRIGALMSLVLVSALAYAEGDDIARARSHFEAGRAMYRLEQYSDALREFSAAYQLLPKPQFLANLGLCYDKLGDGARDGDQKREMYEHARDMYQKYLAEAPPKDAVRDQIAQLSAELDKKLTALPPPAPPKPRVVEPAPAPPAPQPAPPASATQAPPAATVQTATPPKKSFIKRHWWIIPVSAVVVAGVAVGIYFGVRSTGPDCSSASLGCIPAGM